MPECLYSIPLCYLATILILSGWNAVMSPPSRPNTSQSASIFSYLAKSRFFSTSSILMGILILTGANQSISMAGATLAAIITLIGILTDRNGECECFGSGVGLSKTAIFSIRSLALLSYASILLFLHRNGRANISEAMWVNAVVAAGLIAYCFSRSSKNRLPGQDLEKHTERDSTMHSLIWAKDEFLGLDTANKSVQLHDIVSDRKMPLLIFASKDCTHCSSLISDMKILAPGFSARFTFVVIYHDHEPSDETAHLKVLYDPEKHIYSKVKAEGTPFAILFNPELQQISPAAFGSGKIRILFALALNLLERTEMNEE